MIKKCPKCGSTKIIYDENAGEFKCAECGYVIEEGLIDRGPEWRAYDDTQRILRARADPSPSLGSKISIGSLYIKDKSGRRLSSEKNRKFKRMVRTQRYLQYEDRSLMDAEIEIDRIVSSLRLPPIVKNEAFKYYKKARELNLIKGKSSAGFASACILAACKSLERIVCDLDELVKHSRVSDKDLRKYYKTLIEHKIITAVRPSKPLQFIPSIASKLGLPMEVQRLAIQILHKIDETKKFQSKTPKGVAAASLYISSVILNEKRKQSEVAKAANIATPTLRKNLKNILEVINIEVQI
ncbi:MAG: hypothetical protein J7K23_07625 [Thermoproteales archaeon]|nr:hypothetical protein [Thermoproteales archaeon]